MRKNTTSSELTCLGCKQPAPENLFDHWGTLYVDATLHEVKSAYHWCPGCGLVSALPVPSEELLLGHYTTMDSADAILCDERSQVAADWILERAQPTSILEVGCGNGGLLDLLRKTTGCEVLGVDPSTVRREKAEGRSVPIVSSVEEARGQYDLVILSHVLEHVAEPRKMLDELASHVTPDGVIYVEVPALELAEAASEQIVHLTHVHHWTGSTLEETCRNRGLVRIDRAEDLVDGYPCARILVRPGNVLPSVVDAKSAKDAFAHEAAKIQQKYDDVAAEISRRGRAVLFGAGSDTLHLLRTHPGIAANIEMIVDSTQSKHGLQICGVPVRPLQDRPPNVPVFLLAMMPTTQASMQRSLQTGSGGRQGAEIIVPGGIYA